MVTLNFDRLRSDEVVSLYGDVCVDSTGGFHASDLAAKAA